MDIRLPDGRILKNVPEGTTKAQIEAKLGTIAPKQKAAPSEALEPTPGSEPLSYGNMMKESVGNVGKSLISGGGLFGVGGTAIGEGFKNLSKIGERGGYQAGGAVTDVLAPHVSPETAATGGYLTNVGVQSIPTILSAILGGRVGDLAGKKSGKFIMQSALKPDKASRMSGDADDAIQTMFDKGINVTSGGEAKLQGMADELNKKIKLLIAPSNKYVNKSEAAKEINDIIGVFRKQVNPSKDIQTIINSWDEFNRVNPNSFPVQKAQDMKVGTYKILKDRAFSGELQNAEKEAQMALARGLKNSIEKAEPAVGPLNKELGPLLNALELVESRVGAGGNNNLTGLAGAAMNPQSMAMMLADRSSLVKSLLARALYQGGGATGTALGGSAGALYGNQTAK